MNGEEGTDSDAVPPYLEKWLDSLAGDERGLPQNRDYIPTIERITAFASHEARFAYLLLARHRITDRLGRIAGLSPELILRRATVYEALGYSDLALADAYVSYTLCEVALTGPEISDLEPTDVHGDPWPGTTDDGVAHDHKYRSLVVLARSAITLGCQQQAKIWIDEMLTLKSSIDLVLEDLDDHFTLSRHDQEAFRLDVAAATTDPKPLLFGWSRREIYPWNVHEPDRKSKEELHEINSRLRQAAPNLEVNLSALPNLVAGDEDMDPSHSTDADHGEIQSGPPTHTVFQLGLYAKTDLAPDATVLEERSLLTAIRPHGEALCDACAADMETIPAQERRSCAGCSIPFCSPACHTLAQQQYHAANELDDETDQGYSPAETPFCPGISGNDDLHILGRAESSASPEWDLYFLLLSRTLQMAETQHVHPLDLFAIKYLWGDFTPLPVAPATGQSTGPRTLPYSIRHHVEQPLQWFEILMHSRDDCRPYSRHWLQNYDWWIVQTLFAKFRGVANAQQSSWTGKPEIAAVHPLWCLANHSCNPNVTWKPSGVRNLTVVGARAWQRPGSPGRGEEWRGIKAGEEIWNHYTDIKEADYRERRARLQAVLGGDCRCERCDAEAASA